MLYLLYYYKSTNADAEGTKQAEEWNGASKIGCNTPRIFPFLPSLSESREEREEDVKELESRPHEHSIMSSGALVYKYSRTRTRAHTHTNTHTGKDGKNSLADKIGFPWGKK